MACIKRRNVHGYEANDAPGAEDAAELAKAQEEIKTMTAEATAGGGMVKVGRPGRYDGASITIDPAAIDPEDADMLQDMVCAAVNEALRAVSAQGSARIGQATGGMNIPGLM